MYPSIDGWPIDRCQACGHAFCRGRFDTAHTASQFDDRYFKGGGVGYPDYLAEPDIRRRLARAYAKRLQALAGAHGLTVPGSALDVGCAAGFMMQGLSDAGWRASGVDPNASMVAHARHTLGLDAHVGQAETLSRTLDLAVPANGFDLITLVQVVGHLIDPGRAVAEAVAVLAPGGLLLVETWDSQSRIARLFGTQWQELTPPNVLHYFTRASLNRLMAGHGLSCLHTARVPKRLQVAHLRNFVRHRYALAGRMMAALMAPVPGRWSLPYPGDDLFFSIYRRERR
ncbi:MAG: class I SAM-dependent methyltransferase [Burkholderiaceae bacterium]